MEKLELQIVRAQQAIATMRERFAVAAADEEGQTTAEYVAVIVLIAALIAGMSQSQTIIDAITNAVEAAFGNVEDQVSTGEGG